MNTLNRKTVLFWLLLSIFCFGCQRSTIQKDKNYVVELIGSDFDFPKIESLAKRKGASDSHLYQWKNHVVLYSQFKQMEDFTNELAREFPGLQIKVYDQPFYHFSKAERCANAGTASEWKHIILTANMVKDKKLQQEYLEYHRTQFEKWPEISQGFCNAQFQQLSVYKNGRQLMLVISIPAGKTLDELNPKTVENNPRMDEWNRMMGKYQEGIEGTEANEKWVFLNNIK
jgi:L-rhamnose mutarotase